MRNFNVTVNGKQYTVGVEELGANAPAPVAAPAATPAAAPVTPAPAAAPAAAASGTKVMAPMPGNIIATKANVGDAVKEGQVIVVLEAMKMENDIVSPCDGTLTSLTVKKGDTVESNQVIATVG